MTREMDCSDIVRQESAMELLEHMVKREKQIVTVKSFSRKLRKDVNSARSEMEDFVSKHKDHVHVTYLLTGYALEVSQSSVPNKLIKIVQQEDVEDLKSKLKDPACHLFSIEPARMESWDDLENLNWTTMSEDSMEAMRECRVIKNPSIALKKELAFAASSQPVATTSIESKKASNPPTSAQTSVASKTLPAAFISKSSDITSAPGPSKSTNIFAKSAAAKKEAAKTSFFQNQIRKDSEKKTRELQDKARKEEEREKRKEKIRADQVKEDLKHQAATEQLASLFDDDDDIQMVQAEVNEAKINEPAAPAPTNSDVAIDVEDNSEKIVRRVRKRRKVIKKETKLVGKYLRTTDVEGWESYSEDEVVVRKSPSRAPEPVQTKASKPTAITSDEAEKPEKKSKTAKKMEGQKTLTSFFKKPFPTGYSVLVSDMRRVWTERADEAVTKAKIMQEAITLKVKGVVKGVALIWELELTLESSDGPEMLHDQLTVPALTVAIHCKDIIEKLLKIVEEKDKEMALLSENSTKRKLFDRVEFLEENATLQPNDLTSNYFVDPVLSNLHFQCNVSRESLANELADGDFQMLHDSVRESLTQGTFSQADDPVSTSTSLSVTSSF
ncbi:hypothetical protein HDU97_001942 [Phlyctochytrium planicorne]|nr:hypothetical protein HDU97_001942 [Phlyctochytrium planicorne]